MKTDWPTPVSQLIYALRNNGYTILKQKDFICRGTEDIEIYDWNIHKNDIDICLYNHTDISHIIGNVVQSKKNLFFKPTVPKRGYTTLDPLGYGPYSSIYYEKPDFNTSTEETINSFYETQVKEWIQQRSSKWEGSFNPDGLLVQEEDYYLVLGQCFGDEVVKRHDYGSYREKLEAIVAEICRVDKKRKVVVKLHPYTNGESADKVGGFASLVQEYLEKISENVVVYSGNLSIHDFLPKCRCVFVANSGAGFEAMMHNKPIVSWGSPEYHWVTYKLVHLADTIRAIQTENWFNSFSQQQFLYWYTNNYCFFDNESCDKRLKQLIND